MTRRLTLLTIVLSLLAIGTAYLSAFLPGGAPGWAAWLMALGIAALMTATMALGAVRRGRIQRLWLPLAFTFLILATGFGTALYLPPIDSAAPPNLWLGLPPGAAVILYGIGVLPLLVVPIAYALTFEEATLNDADLEELRAAANRLRQDAAKRAPAVPMVPVQISAPRPPSLNPGSPIPDN
jgi:hypothetical protein